MIKQQRVKLRYADMAPRKMRLVADTIRGLTVNEAEAQLSASPRRAAKKLLKVLQSAVANAKNNQQLKAESLIVSSIQVDGGPSLKRWLPRARGTATPILKRRSHVTLVLRESEKATPPRFNPKVVKVVKEKKAEDKEQKKVSEWEKEFSEKRSADVSKPGFFRRIFRRKSV
ncbi:50S ribosomal protein L22 [Candidatus Wolfebacteria bacterium RIFCSPLOWO2_01_FULL_45_19]|uniref:Large ribosomal subunit protein uL22 n=1 Tax=Candidatus Wolfebacteria bacterium RIFCSPLOWO2_01_FULL_45_19 TaxID=1802557 RepID=A0A1F8DUU4_9BACT|nr:MAG: 50S ribosomal protein L22 [Parcubacteria group bacterium GW2011_GWB1_45_9]OGM91605.1 MAG: 50S ribosomal protein L22 [Candidatus Wolfebacteria bacterium RIFCSPLOWO2_01_FULL_45_19]